MPLASAGGLMANAWRRLPAVPSYQKGQARFVREPFDRLATGRFAPFVLIRLIPLPCLAAALPLQRILWLSFFRLYDHSVGEPQRAEIVQHGQPGRLGFAANDLFLFRRYSDLDEG